MRLMDVITTYLHGFIDNDIYMKFPKGFRLPEVNNTKYCSTCLIKLQQSLYGLKQSRRTWYNHLSEYLLKASLMWYNRLSEYLLEEGYANNPICPCIFIKKLET